MTKIDITLNPLDNSIQTLGRHFKAHGHDIRLVGGAVRDILRNEEPKDFDFATTATPDEMLKMSDKWWTIIPTGIDHGTVTFMNGLQEGFEVTTLRKDVETDGRHAEVEFTNDWEIDAERRDLTINAMSMELDNTLHDYFAGEDDLKNGIIRFVGDADKRIKEDALRIMRFFRFGAKFGTGNGFDDGAIFACIDNRQLIRNISVERIWQEIKSASKNQETFEFFVRQIIEFQILEEIGIDISSDHRLTVSTIAREFPTFAMACFLDTHEVENFCETLKLSNEEISQLKWFHAHKNIKPTEELVEDMLVDGVSRFWINTLSRFHNVLSADIIFDMRLPIFPVTGGDLITRGIEAGPQMGKILSNLKAVWKTSRYALTKDELLNMIL